MSLKLALLNSSFTLSENCLGVSYCLTKRKRETSETHENAIVGDKHSVWKPKRLSLHRSAAISRKKRSTKNTRHPLIESLMDCSSDRLTTCKQLCQPLEANNVLLSHKSSLK